MGAVRRPNQTNSAKQHHHHCAMIATWTIKLAHSGEKKPRLDSVKSACFRGNATPTVATTDALRFRTGRLPPLAAGPRNHCCAGDARQRCASTTHPGRSARANAMCKRGETLPLPVAHPYSHVLMPNAQRRPPRRTDRAHPPPPTPVFILMSAIIFHPDKSVDVNWNVVY